MIATSLPGIEPDAPRPERDRFYRVPRGAGGYLKGKARILVHIADRRDEDDWCHDGNRRIAEAVGLTPSTVGLYIGRMAADGLLHIEGGTRRRRIRPLLVPLDASDRRPAIRMRAHSNPEPIRMRAHSNSPPQVPANQRASPPGPLFEQDGGRNNVDVGTLPDQPPTRTREAVPGPPAVAGPDVADGIDRELAGLSCEQLRERIAELTGRIDASKARGRACDVMERCELSARVAEARGLLEARERPQAPPTTPEVVSLGAAAAVAPAATPAARPPAPSPHVETPDLIRRLKSQGAAVVALVVARLCEKLDPDFEPLYRRCCADVLAGRLDAGEMAAAFRWARNAPARGVKKGPSFAAYIAQKRDDRRPKPPPFHRRE